MAGSGDRADGNGGADHERGEDEGAGEAGDILVKLVEADEHGAIPLCYLAAGPSGADAQGICMGRAKFDRRRNINHLAGSPFRVGKYRHPRAVDHTIKRR